MIRVVSGNPPHREFLFNPLQENSLFLKRVSHRDRGFRREFAREKSRLLFGFGAVIPAVFFRSAFGLRP